MNTLPLVSVNVCSYNASETIKETLDSIYLQSYHNIELIISDDCSKDKTYEIANSLAKNDHRIKVLTAEKNQGIVRNCNRVRRESQGEWIKGIAADDKLFPNCIEDYVDYCMQNPDAEFVTSIQKVYNNTFDEENCINPNCICKDLSIFDKNANEQLKKVAYRVLLFAPTIFLKKSLYDEVGGYDERYFHEDHPFYVKVLEAGHKIYFMNKVTVGYRVHNSVTNSNNRLFNYNFIKHSKKFRWERCFQYYNWRQKLAVRSYFFIMQIMNSCGLNNKKLIHPFFYNKMVGLILHLGDWGTKM